MKLKDTSYDLFLKKNYFTKEAKIPLHVRYDFGYIVVAKYQNQNIGKFIDTKTVAREAVKKFKEGKFKELNKTKNWSNSVKRKNLISEQQRNDLLIKIDDLRKKLASDENDSLLAYEKIISDLNLAKRSHYKFDQMLEKEFSEYNKTIKDLNSFIEKNEVFVHATSLFLNEGKKYLNNNKKALNEIYSKTLIKSFYENIEICLTWCKNPVFLIQKEQIDELEIVKADFEDFKTKLIAYELQEKENLLEAERNSNKNITGFLETNFERKEREQKENYEFTKYQEKLNNIQSYIIQISNLKTFAKELEIISSEFNAIKNLSIQNYIKNKEHIDYKLDIAIEATNEIVNQINKSSEDIISFLKSKNKKVLIIEGMAGTGKTAKITEIIKFSYNELGYNGENILITAPSTVGAANIRQRWRLKSEVFQKLINTKAVLKFNQVNTNENIKLFICDEANMLTSTGLKCLFQFFKKTNLIKFIFIGDSGQINAYDFDRDESEESPALMIDKISTLGKIPESQISIIHLEIDYRFIFLEDEYFLSAMKWLREESTKVPLFENFLEKANYPKSNVINMFEHKNVIIESFNKNLSIFEYLENRIEIGQEIDVERLKKRFNLKFKIENIKNAIDEYHRPENRRPELGKIYSELFPNIKERTRKPENVDSSIILRRDNDGILDSNRSLRPHLFKNSNQKLKDIMIGELLFIKKVPKRITGSKFKTNLEDGDLVVVTKIESEFESNGELISKVGVKPVTKRLNSWSQKVINELDKLQKFLNLNISFFSEQSISIWHGNLDKVDDYSSWSEYIDSKINLSNNYDFKELPYLVTYGYTRTMFTAQGGEWENVFIHPGDMWGYTIKEQKKYLYTAVSRTSKKVYFSN